MTPEEMLIRADTAQQWRKALKKAVAQARNEALEEAARVAEGTRHPHVNEKDAYDIAWDVCCGEIAAAIRALKK